MTFTWNSWAVPGIAALVVALTLAALLLSSETRGAKKRSLVGLLAAEGVAVGATTGLPLMTRSAELAAFYGFSAVVAIQAALVFYLKTLTLIQRSPLSFLRTTWGHRFLTAVGFVSLVPVAIWPQAYVARIAPGAHVAWRIELGPAYFVLLIAAILILFFGIVSAFAARLISNPKAKQQARAFLIAFGAQGAGYGLLLWMPLLNPDYVQSPFLERVWIVGVPTTTITFSLLLTGGILRSGFLDIDFGTRSRAVATSFATIMVLIVLGTLYLLALLAQPELGLVVAVVVLLIAAAFQQHARAFTVWLARRLWPTA